VQGLPVYCASAELKKSYSEEETIA